MARPLKISRPICSLFAALTVCLAFGFLMAGRLVVPSAAFLAEQRTSSNAEAAQSGGGEATNAAAETGDVMRTADIVRAMTLVGAVVFCWTLALQWGATYLILSRFHGEHTRKQMKSDEESMHRTKDLVRTRDAVIFGLAKLAESRDADTGHHLERIALYSTKLAAAMRKHSKYREQMTSQFVQLIGVSSALHDIGKVGVEDSILLKPGSLTPDERRRMQSHTTVGAKCIHDIEVRLGNSNFLQMAQEIVKCHHERWDGTGYPAGLTGEEIPLAARIVAIADVYDALSARRVYKAPYPHEKCVDVIRIGAGKQFDPDLVEVFLTIESQFREIAQQYPETMSAESTVKVASNREPEHRLTPNQEELLILPAAVYRQAFGAQAIAPAG
jgi:response regulator RpfG family c-di-GMP phosphodiesterase